MPHLYRETVAPIIMILNANPKTTFLYRWIRKKRVIESAFRWEPASPVHVEDVAKEIGKSASLEEISLAVTGGGYCTRGSNFCDSAPPSAVALSHRAMRVSLIYEFVVKMRGLGEGRSGAGVGEKRR